MKQFWKGKVRRLVTFNELVGRWWPLDLLHTVRVAFGDLRVGRIAFTGWRIIVNPLIVIVDGDGEHFLGVILADHVLI